MALLRGHARICLIAVLLATALPAVAEELPVTTIPAASAADLDAMAAYTFVLFGDQKGLGPGDEDMDRTIQWIADMKAVCAIGMGDHLTKGGGEGFLAFVAADPFWSTSFWPGVADGENEYYGASQGDWGAGGRILADCRVLERECVTVRENGCEYYAAIPTPSGTLHLVQAHYPDQPLNPMKAFPPASRAWMRSTIEGIEEREGDIVIAGAHSLMGDFLAALSPDDRAAIVAGADITISGTTHCFHRYDYGPAGALALNTGAVGVPRGCPSGFISVHVLPDPWRLLAQYVSTETETRELAPPDRAYLKDLATGRISQVVFE